MKITDALTTEERKRLRELANTATFHTRRANRLLMEQPGLVGEPTLDDLITEAVKADEALTEFMEVLRLTEAINDDSTPHDDTLTIQQRFKLNELIRNATEAITAVWPAVNPWIHCEPLETIQCVTAIADETWGDFMHALIALEEEINGEEGDTP